MHIFSKVLFISQCRIFTIVILLMSNAILMHESAGYNDLGYTRIGPLRPLLYPDSVSTSETIQIFQHQPLSGQVSIVVPCYNCGPYILKALESFEVGFELMHRLIKSQVSNSLQNPVK